MSIEENQKTDKKNLLLYVFIFAIISIILSKLVLPFLFASFFEKENKLLFTFIGQMVAYVIPLIGLFFITTPSDTFHKNKNLLGMQNIVKKPVIKEVVFSIILAVFLFFAIKFFSLFMQNIVLAIKGDVGEIEKPGTVGALQFTFILVVFALMPSLIEETYHRGVLYQVSPNSKIAFVMSVIPFCLLHSSITTAISAFLFAVAIFFVMHRSKNLLYLYIIHFIYNIFSAIFAYLVFLPLEPFSLIEHIAVSTDLFSYAFLSLLISLILFIPVLFFINKFKKKDCTFVYEKYSKMDYILFAALLFVYVANFIIVCLNSFLQ